jgi:DNA mismatch repair protein MSH3
LLCELYSYVDDSSVVDPINVTGPLQPASSAPPSFVCFTEINMGGMGADERVKVYMIAVIVQTGEVVYDEFEAGHLRTELEVSRCRSAEAK